MSKEFNDDEYENICYLCRRPESKAGKMVTLASTYVYVQNVCRKPLIH